MTARWDTLPAGAWTPAPTRGRPAVPAGSLVIDETPDDHLTTEDLTEHVAAQIAALDPATGSIRIYRQRRARHRAEPWWYWQDRVTAAGFGLFLVLLVLVAAGVLG